MKVSEWLNENISSHSIYDSNALKADFREQTGQEPDWPEHSTEGTAQAMKNRGLGGHLDLNASVPNCWGYQMASHFARKLANYRSTKLGRGFLFRDCIEALVKAGF